MAGRRSTQRTQQPSQYDYEEEEEVAPPSGQKGKKPKISKKGESDSEEEESGTQKTSLRGQKALEKMTPEEKEKRACEMVRCVLATSAKKTHFAFSDLTPVMEGYSGGTAEIFRMAEKHLLKVFGFKVVELDSEEDIISTAETKLAKKKASSVRRFILINALEVRDKDMFYEWKDAVPQWGLLVTVLTLVYLHHNKLSLSTLKFLLGKLGVEWDLKHPVLGRPDEAIKGFLAERYLSKVNEVVGENRDDVYSFGLRANTEFSERDIVSFIAKVFGENPEEMLRKLNKHKQPAANNDED